MLFQDKTQTVLIVAPTFEISVQIYKVILRLLQGMSESLVVGHLANLKNKLEDHHLLVTTPKKFLDFYEKLENRTYFDSIQHIVLDEADKYFELSYVPQLEQILNIFKCN